MRKLIVALLSCVALAPGAADAAKPAAQSTIVLDQTEPIFLGDQISFTTTVAKLSGWETAVIVTECWQGTTQVWQSLHHPGESIFIGGSNRISPWGRAGGDGDCAARLVATGWGPGHVYQNRDIAGPVTFHVTDA